MDPATASVEALLRRREAWPEEMTVSAASIERRETHLSIVYLVGNLAFKLKKAVNLGFVDFSTLDARRAACLEEVRLNRRSAGSIYRGVAAVVRAGDGVRVVPTGGMPGSTEEVVDWLVEMERLPEEGMLDALLARGAVDGPGIDELATVIGRFLESCPTSAAIAAHGAPERVRRRMMANLAELDEAIRRTAAGDAEGHAGRLRLLEWLAGWTDSELTRRAPLIRARADACRVRDGHGDLHAGNICRRPPDPGGRWIPFDCIEFRQDFRCVDAAAEIAFLTMDIAHRGRPDLARRLRAGAAAVTRDGGLAALHGLWGSHFAAVRAKVVLDRAAASAVRPALLAEADGYLDHAAALALPPVLVLTCGLPGSGKSTVARAIAPSLEADRHASDLVRKRLAGLDPTDRSGRDPGSGLYSAAMDGRVLEMLLARARLDLAEGRSTVIDATSARRAWRDRFLALARDLGVDAWLVHVDPPVESIRARIARRAEDPTEPSDADEAILERFLETFEPPDEWPTDRRVEWDGAPEGARRRLLRQLVERHPATVGRVSSGGRPRRS